MQVRQSDRAPLRGAEVEMDEQAPNVSLDAIHGKLRYDSKDRTLGQGVLHHDRPEGAPLAGVEGVGAGG